MPPSPKFIFFHFGQRLFRETHETSSNGCVASYAEPRSLQSHDAERNPCATQRNLKSNCPSLNRNRANTNNALLPRFERHIATLPFKEVGADTP